MTAPSGPLVIAGIGGSGTRVFSRIARAAGRDMGNHVNESDDAVALMGFADRWLGPYHEARLAGRDPVREAKMREELEASLERHRAGMRDDASWGWKQPRSIHFLPLLHRSLPGLRFLHVVRDGRDVAFGRQAPIVLENAGDALLGDGWRARPLPVALIELWSIANALAADYGEASMGADYTRVRFEDLCLAPPTVTGEVAQFAGAPVTAGPEVRAIARGVTWPSSIGSWRDADPRSAHEVERAGRVALERFGYAGTRFRRPLVNPLRAATRRVRRS